MRYTVSRTRNENISSIYHATTTKPNQILQLRQTLDRLRLEPAHSTHTSHSTHTASWRRLILLRRINNRALARRQQASDTSSVHERRSDNLKRVNNPRLDHIHILALRRVISPRKLIRRSILVQQRPNNHAALLARVVEDGAGRGGECTANDSDTEFLVEVRGGHGLGVGGGGGGGGCAAGGVGAEGEGGFEEGDTASWEDTLFDSSAGSVERVVVPVLLLADFNLARAADADDGDTAREFGETLLELGLVVLRGSGVVDERTDLFAAGGDVVLRTAAVEDDGVLFGDGDGAGLAEEVGGGFLELDVELVGEDGAAGEDGKVTEDGLPVVTEAWGLDGADLELATELVEDAGSEGLTVNVLGDDDQWAPGLGSDLERGEDVLEERDLLLAEQDVWLLELDLLGLDVGDEVWGDEASVEPHALSHVDLVLGGLSLLDGDDTLLADLLHGLGNEVADVGVTVGGDGGYLSNLGGGGDGLGVSREELDDAVDGSLGASSEVHGVAASSDVLHTLRVDGTGQDSGSRRSVTGNLVGLAGNILDETGKTRKHSEELHVHKVSLPSTEVLELVLQLYRLGNSYTVWGIGVSASSPIFQKKTAKWADTPCKQTKREEHYSPLVIFGPPKLCSMMTFLPENNIKP